MEAKDTLKKKKQKKNEMKSTLFEVACSVL